MLFIIIRQIKAEFSQVMGSEDLPRQVKDNFNKVWCRRLLAYAEKNGDKLTEVMKKMQRAIDCGILEEGIVSL